MTIIVFKKKKSFFLKDEYFYIISIIKYYLHSFMLFYIK